MVQDRRGPERRIAIRRENPPNDPGPPPEPGAAPPAKSDGTTEPKDGAPESPERRVADRRSGRRRGGRPTLPPAAGTDSAGWKD